MTFAKTFAAACAATLMLAGAASAADLPPAPSGGYGIAMHRGYGMHHRHLGRHHGAMFGFGHRSSAAGRAKQRHRTHLDRCENVPSRC